MSGGVKVLRRPKAGEQLAFNTYPNLSNAKVLKTVVYTADLR